QSKVEANFPEQSALGMFSAAVRAKAFDSEDEPKTGPLVLGVDPARYGDDRTAVVAKRGRLCWVVDSWMGMDTVSSASRVLHLASELRERDAEIGRASWRATISKHVIARSSHNNRTGNRRKHGHQR